MSSLETEAEAVISQPDAAMRVSVPTIPTRSALAPSAPPISPAAAIERISEFLRPGNVCLLTGAGVSVDSGIRAYRGKDGRYMNPNYKYVRRNKILIRTSDQAWCRSLQAYLCMWPYSPGLLIGLPISNPVLVPRAC
jgi:hypothetical protein